MRRPPIPILLDGHRQAVERPPQIALDKGCVSGFRAFPRPLGVKPDDSVEL